ncbi:MAG: hypothetical protein Q9221_007496 [Calogaya cf. arnoldii]
MIRQEIQSIDKCDLRGINSLPILDSFIKEAVRVNPLDKMGIRRKALKPYTFSNGGPRVSIGDIACVPSWEIMHDAAKYPNPEMFDGLRFVDASHSRIGVPCDNVMRERPLRMPLKTFQSGDSGLKFGRGQKLNKKDGC